LAAVGILEIKLTNFNYLTLQAFASVLIMFLINWGYALANISVALLVYIYIGQANPGLSKGVASEFVFSKWVQSLWDKLTR